MRNGPTGAQETCKHQWHDEVPSKTSNGPRPSLDGLPKLDVNAERTKSEWVEHFFRVTDFYVGLSKWQDAEIERLQREVKLLEIVGNEQTQRIAELKSIIRGKTFVTGDETPAALPEYTRVIGEAGEKYLRSVALNGAHSLPGMFRWHELWEEMCKASVNNSADKSSETTKSRAEKLEFALRGLYLDNVDYLTLNKLGGMNNHWMRAAREALGMDVDDTSIAEKTPERRLSPQYDELLAQLSEVCTCVAENKATEDAALCLFCDARMQIEAQQRTIGLLTAERRAQKTAEQPEPLTGVDFLHTWMRTPNPSLGGIVPIDMLKHGKGQKLAQFIEAAYEAGQAPAERCNQCDQPLPPLSEWSTPTCPTCTERLPGIVSGSELEESIRQAQSVPGNCEHGIPRRFCTAVHTWPDCERCSCGCCLPAPSYPCGACGKINAQNGEVSQ